MIVGVPREIKADEYRVAMLPVGVEELIRVTLGRVESKLVAVPLRRGAGVITTMVQADGLLRIPSLTEGINAGETVEIELLRPA